MNENHASSNSRTLHARTYSLHHPHAFSARQQLRLIAIAPAHHVQIRRVDRVEQHSDERFARAKGGVGISASFNTLFGSPVSAKINALIDTSWASGDGRIFYDFGTTSRAGDEEKRLVEPAKCCIHSHGPRGEFFLAMVQKAAGDYDGALTEPERHGANSIRGTA